MLVSFDPNTWYKLTNAYYGPSTPLDIVNEAGHNSSGVLKMAAWAPRGHTGQRWQFRPHEDKDGTYKLCTWFLGTSKCLDVYGDDKRRPHLADEGSVSGQKWRVVPWLEKGSWDGTFKLCNMYSGKDLFLDTWESSKRLWMTGGNCSGTHWNIETIRPITSEEHLMG